MISKSRQGNHYDVAGTVDAENIVYPMHPDKSEAIRRWAISVGQEQSQPGFVSSNYRDQNRGVGSSGYHDANCVVGNMPVEESISSAESDSITMCSENEESIPERINRTAHFLNLVNSNVHPPELSYVNPPKLPSSANAQLPSRPKFIRKTSMFSGSSGITLAGGTFINCAGSVNVTHASDGGRSVTHENVDSNGNLTVTRILNAGTVDNSGCGQASWDNEKEPHIRFESNLFSGIKNTVFTGGTFTHAPQFNCVVYGQGSPDTINAMPNGLPPRHLRSPTPPPAYSARE